MTDQITSVTQNQDGSFAFNFTFDNGSGVLGNTVVLLPAQQGTPAVYEADGVTVVSPAVAAVPYTLETAKAAILPIASEQKREWINALGRSAVTGDVTL